MVISVGGGGGAVLFKGVFTFLGAQLPTIFSIDLTFHRLCSYNAHKMKHTSSALLDVTRKAVVISVGGGGGAVLFKGVFTFLGAQLPTIFSIDLTFHRLCSYNAHKMKQTSSALLDVVCRD